MTKYAQLKQLGLFDARVPRYTSYPTAPHFSADVGADTTAQWLGNVPSGSTVSVYLHVPFCRRLCWFCACRTQGTSTLTPVAAYVETLLKEIDLLAANLPSDIRIEHLHWGGGTPTLLSPEMISTLAKAIFEHWPAAEGAQFSVEIDPNEIDEPRMDALLDAGLNRASIGVQDFDPEIQKTIGRIQDFETTRDVAAKLRDRGIESLNMDILYGLPFQTARGIARSVEQLIDLSPDRVALYGYAHVPWMARRQSMIPSEALPSPTDRLLLFETARQLFEGAGYEQIGIDNFVKPHDGLATARRNGTMRRNFQGYTEDTSDTLIGLGASAISRYPGGYAQNNPATSGYQGAVRGGELATTRGHAFTEDDRLRARVIERLMCDFQVSFDAVEAESGMPTGQVRQIAQNICNAFADSVVLDGDVLAIAPHGRPLTRMIARHFDAYAVSESGHSHAI